MSNFAKLKSEKRESVSKLVKFRRMSLIFFHFFFLSLCVEVGVYHFDKDNKIYCIEYNGELQGEEDSNCMDKKPPVGPPLLYAEGGQPLKGPPPPTAFDVMNRLKETAWNGKWVHFTTTILIVAPITLCVLISGGGLRCRGRVRPWRAEDENC